MTRFCSIFNQVLQLFPRVDFQKAVIDTKAERHARGFTCWEQFVAMMFCQLGRAHSLREICGGLASCEGKLAHLGVEAPKRATLAYANAHRPWQLYQTVFYQVLALCREVAGAKPFRFKNKLLSLDATVIDLCAEMFPWAVFRRTKGAVKLHFTLDHDGYLPTFLVITDGKHHEGPLAREQTFPPGTVLVFDKGYTDFEWFADLTAAWIFFVTPAEAQCRLHRGRAPHAAAGPRHCVRSDHSVPGPGDTAEISRSAPACCGAHARGRPARVPDQSPDARGVDRGADLQGPVADRAVFQSLEAEPAGEDVCRDVGQCAAHSNLDRAHRPARVEVFAIESALRLVAVEPGRPAPDEPAGVSRPLGLAQRALYQPAAARGPCPSGVGVVVIQTASREVSFGTSSHTPPFAKETRRLSL